MIKKNRSSWSIDVTIHKKRYRLSGFKTKSEAESWIHVRKKELPEESWRSALDSNFRTKTIEEIAKPYRIHILKTRAAKSVYIVDNIVSEFGHVICSKLLPSDVSEYIESLFESNAIGSVKLYLSYFNAIFNFAIKNQVIDINPIKTVNYSKQFRGAGVRNTIVTPEQWPQLKELFKKERWYIQGVIEMMWWTGMRISEVLSLTWKDINITEGAISLEAERVKERSDRVIGIEPELSEYLSSLKKQPRKNAYVFGITNDIPLTYETVYQTWKRVTKKSHEFSDLLPHDLRHSWVTRKRQEGHDREVIKIQSGHSTDSMFKRYNSVRKDEVIAMSGFDRSKSELISEDISHIMKKCSENGITLSTLHTLIRKHNTPT